MKNVFLILTLSLLLINCNNEKINFDRLIYRTTGCFGTCPSYYIEINSDKTFKLFAETVYKANTSIFDFEYDSAKIGYFRGILSEENFKKLNSKIEVVNAKGYKYDRNEMITDTPEISLIIQRGGDKTCFQTFYPTKNFKNNVVIFLNDICENSKMVKTEEFYLEFKNGCR